MTEKEEPEGFKFDVKEFRDLNNKWAKLPKTEAMEAMRQYYVGIAKFFPEMREPARLAPKRGRAKVYLETTMFNRYFEGEREYTHETKLLFTKILEGTVDAYTSTTVLDELERTVEPKRGQMLELVPTHNITIIDTKQDALSLADTYIALGVISRKYHTDGVHIAVATISNMDYIISLNFQHINRTKTKSGTVLINLMYGYANPEICTPMEVIYDI